MEFDTGALLHGALKTQGHRFVALPEAPWSDVRHFHGVRRAELTNRLRRMLKADRLATTDSETAERSIAAEVKQRLAEGYGVRVP